VITCQACGADNPDGSAFCKNCATRLDPNSQERIAERRAAHSSTGVRWSAVLLAIIIAIVLIAVVALLVTHLL
jgi:uncharacterized membrane protein YvbJ